MNLGKSPTQVRNKPPPASRTAPPPPAPAALKVAPLFRPVDWWAMGICFVVVAAIYIFWLAPEVTLEDSGELSTGSFWAGIPHPPGYPFWAIYSWLWTQLVPFGNVAWRVELGDAVAEAMGCSLIALMVSRGSSMFMESIEELRGIVGKWESAICLVCGVTAGLLMALDDTMWFESEAINRISLFGVPWVIIVLLSLMRWIYAPHQRGYLYCAFFFLGISATIHQSLLVMALGIEIGISFTQPKLGRDLFFGNALVWIGLMAAKGTGAWASFAQSTDMVSKIINAVGIGSILACVALSLRPRFTEQWTRKDKIISGVFTGLLLLALWTACFFTNGEGGLSYGVTFLATVGLVLAVWGLRLLTESLACLFMGLLWLAGSAFYFYEAIAGMTNPPMEWGYPRTVEGFFHALTRGQYDKMNPSNIIDDPHRFLVQLGTLLGGVADAFSWVYMLFALLPFLFFLKMQKRERCWLISVAATYPFLGVMMTILFNPSLDRQTADLLKVFFVASHTVVAILMGCGLALTAAYMATHYEKFRKWGWLGGAVALGVACWCLLETTAKHYFGRAGEVSLGTLPHWLDAILFRHHEAVEGEMTLGSVPHWVAQAFAPGQYGLPIFANLLLVALAILFLGALAVCRKRAPLLVTLGIFAVMPVYSGMAHWFQSEQRNHWFGYWYGHDMFTPPFQGPDGKLTYDAGLREQAMKGTNGFLVYPEMARDAVLYGGTDPGRFCPTYMIYCESFIPHRCQPEQDQHFDRRDVYLITQNALADPTYLDYIRAQYNRFAQVDPPFFQELLPTEFPGVFHKPTALLKPLDSIFESLGASIERRRRIGTSWFQPGDFADAGKLAARLRAGKDALSKDLYGKLSKETRALLEGGADERAAARALAKDFNAILSGPTIYSPDLFTNITLPPLIEEAARDDEHQTPSARVRLNRRMLEEAYPGEIARSPGGVYPDTEIRTASNEELQKSESDYTKDAAQRFMHDRNHPNEPRQIKPGEDVTLTQDGRLSFGGTLAVMGINSFVTKVMFDANPRHEFYVEESFPMDWMFSYLTPFGIIMKVNREPLQELSEETVRRDHVFWSQYSDRLVGNWVTYDTTAKELCDFVERVYLRHDYSQFKGDLKFVRDEDAQKNFSKLRSAIGGSIYEWRAKNDADEAGRARMEKEAEFAFKQAFAYCPYSEAAFRYAQLLLDTGRMGDALLVARTFLKLDPFNGQVQNMVRGLEEAQQPPKTVTVEDVFNQIEAEVRGNQIIQATTMLDQLSHHPQANAMILMRVAELYTRMRNFDKAEEAMTKATQLEPNSSLAWYNLASLQAVEQKTAAAVESLKKAFAANVAERAADPNVADLREHARTNLNFGLIRQTPEFRAVVPEN
jgi:tetratricopeptide (TPR) repeat protein